MFPHPFKRPADPASIVVGIVLILAFATLTAFAVIGTLRWFQSTEHERIAELGSATVGEPITVVESYAFRSRSENVLYEFTVDGETFHVKDHEQATDTPLTDLPDRVIHFDPADPNTAFVSDEVAK